MIVELTDEAVLKLQVQITEISSLELEVVVVMGSSMSLIFLKENQTQMI